MERIFKRCLTSIVVIITLVGCGGSNPTADEFDANAILSFEETKIAFNNPMDHKGKSVEFSGQVFNKIDEDDDFYYYQIFTDFENSDGSLALRIKRELVSSINAWDFVEGNGVIHGKLEGENALGGSVSSAIVDVYSIDIGSFQEIVAKPYLVSEINLSQTQHNHVVTLEKIEFSNYDTRLYMKVENNSNNVVSMYSFNITMIVNGKNYTEDYSYHVDYPSIDAELHPDTTTEGIIMYEFVEVQKGDKVKISIGSPYADDWQLDFNNYVFDFEI